MSSYAPFARRLALSIALSAIAILPSAAAAANHSVTVDDSFFSPADLTIQPGDSVTWTNVGNLPHNVRADDGSFRCANGCDGQGGDGDPSSAGWSFMLTFDDPGEIPYFCEAHGAPGGIGMAGTITVEGSTDPGTIAFTSSGFGVGEGGGSATITAARSGGVDGQVNVAFSTSNGSASAGSDYQAVSGTLTWADGESGTKAFQVPIVDDDQPEGNETVNLALSNPGGGAGLGSPSNATLTIADDDEPAGDPGSLSFVQAGISVSESDPETSVEVRRTDGTAGTVSARVDTSDGSATAGDDYSAVSTTVTFGDGQGGTTSVAIPLLDDSSPEGNETINVALSDPTGGASLSNPTAATVTIVDDDLPAGPCVGDQRTLCLQDDRFQIRVRFEDPNKPELGFQDARKVDLTDRAGLFYFFNEQNVEMLIKVLNNCSGPTNRYWVFFSATTTLAFEVVVIDTEADELKRYTNPPQNAADPVADIGAFDTCP